jgi:hypothetical protein
MNAKCGCCRGPLPNRDEDCCIKCYVDVIERESEDE